jgi:hypothetical protein
MACLLTFTGAETPDNPEVKTMKTTLSTAALVAGMMLLAGCRHFISGPDFTPPDPPTGLHTSTGDNFIELTWRENRESDLDFYRVYVSASYDGRYELIGETGTAYYNDKDARNGSVYYYAVSAVDYDGNESDLSRDVAYDIPRPEGYNVALTDYQVAPATAGYDFSAYSVLPVSDKYVDIWFENYNGTLYMNVGNDSDIKDMGPTASILDIGEAPTGGWSSTHDAVLVSGHTYVVWTWDDHYAKIRVRSLGPNRVTFDWAYQLIKSNPLMKRSHTGDRAEQPVVKTR